MEHDVKLVIFLSTSKFLEQVVDTVIGNISLKSPEMKYLGVKLTKTKISEDLYAKRTPC